MRRILTAKERELYKKIEPFIDRAKIGEMSVEPFRLKSDAPLDIVNARKELLDIVSKQMALARSLGDAC